MRAFGGLLLTLALMAAPAASMAQAQPDPTFAAGVARLRANFEKTKALPSDPSFYAETLHVAHNWDTGRTVKAADLVKTVSFDSYFKENGITNIELTRFVASGDTVIAAVLLTGHKPDGTPTRFTIATFFRLAGGKIVDIQEWYDRSERDQRPYVR
jgi:predicted SnoaL-like aldol condensation-catalyzing enzyme